MVFAADPQSFFYASTLPQTLLKQSILARVLQKQGVVAIAQDMSPSVSGTQAEIFGKNHPAKFGVGILRIQWYNKLPLVGGVASASPPSQDYCNTKEKK